MYRFLSTLLLTGCALAAPSTPRQVEPTCVDRSTKVTLWKVIQFDFHSSYVFTNPSHQNSWGYVNFTLSNPALDYKPICTATSNQLSDFFYGTTTYTCHTPDVPGAGTSTFTFSRPSNELRINQTWRCPDEGAMFAAEGGVKLDLQCEDKTWQNPEWSTGELFSTRNVDCNFVDVETPIEKLSAVRRKQ